VKRLVLFDIDGTLLNGGKLWREVFEGAFIKVFPGRTFPNVSFSGKTDRQICAEVLEELTWKPEASDSRDAVIERLIQEYLKVLSRELRAGRGAEVELLPGVVELLGELRSCPQVRLGLLTGNVREGARLKLGTKGLSQYFGSPELTGAFGDDHSDRYVLPGIAVKRIEAESGIRYRGREVIIIGDTPHDVNCGRSIGVKAIAVGTGRAEYQQALLASGPDYFFNDLRETQQVMQALLGD